MDLPSFPASASLPGVVYAVLTIALVYVISAWYRARSRFNRLRKMGLPMPKWNWLFGHLLVLKKSLGKYPSNIFVPVAIADLASQFSETDMFYLDTWPFSKPILCVCEPDAATQASTKINLPKGDFHKRVLDPITGGPSLLSMNGQEWKYWRTLFNPGFAPQYLLNQVPGIVESVQTFCDKLQERASTGLFCLEDIATRMTVDIIMKVVLDDDLNYQLGPKPLPDALRTMISWTKFGSPFDQYNPFRWLLIRHYGGVMDRYIQAELSKRFEEYKNDDIRSSMGDTTRRSKSVTALAIEGYLLERPELLKTQRTLDPHLESHLTRQIRLFLLGGHDTTTSVLVYTYHLLSQHPVALRRMQAEHTAIFGPNPVLVSDLLYKDPVLLNQLPYTMAVIKETLRLYPPAGTVRSGVRGTVLMDRHGTAYPTDDCDVSLVHLAIQHNPRVWPRPTEFLPERWLVEESDPLHPPTGGFRTFEVGPRSCQGRELSYIELKVALAMTVRRFSIMPAYEEWDRLQDGRKGLLKRVIESVRLREKMEGRVVNGDRVYLVEKAAAHPPDGYPCRVELLF